MREFKFRFHCAGHGITEGYTLLELLTGQNILTKDGTSIVSSIRRDPLVSVMQFTGMHDKNSKEIYEDDVIIASCVNMGQVKFRVRHACWVVECKDGNMYKLCDIEEKKIIGNIYENPELINERN